MRSSWLCFVPLFVAVDAIGVMPMFMALTEGLESRRLPRLVFVSVATATVVAPAFLALGTAILKLLGIAIADFMAAGGILLFVISMTDLLTTDRLL